MSDTSCCQPINTLPPFTEPYRTGSYLIYDIPSPAQDNFREGSSIGLRASGSHQLDRGLLIDKLKSLARMAGTGTVHLVDLRQESHAFFNGRAVSWFADRDWSNVGHSLEWIRYDEQSQIERLWATPNANHVQVFRLTPTQTGQATPSCSCELVVAPGQTGTEEQLTRDLAFCKYHRIPVTDHCKPGVEAEHSFANLCTYLASLETDQVWVHFHCHGGDGRTTTFLTLYDMFCWKKDHPDQTCFPTVEYFALRQLDLFEYDLRPSAACDDPSNWKCALARERWQFLAQWRQKLIDNTWNGCAEHGVWTDPAIIRQPPVNHSLDFSRIDEEENQRILAAGKMSFSMVGCSGDPQPPHHLVKPDNHTSVVAEAMSKDKDLSFFYHLGDIVYIPEILEKTKEGQEEPPHWFYDDTAPLGGSDSYDPNLWQKEFYTPYADFPKKIISIAGNHDGIYDPNSATPLGDYFKNFCCQGSECEAPDQRAPMNQPYIYWRLDTPFAFVIGLYANIANAGILDDPRVYTKANFTDGPQYKWLVEELKTIAEINKSSTPRKAVLLAVHYPPYSGAANFDVRGDPTKGGPAKTPNTYDAPYLADVLQKAFSESGQRPDAIFSAHAHLYQRLTYSFADGTVMPCLVVGCGGHSPVELLRLKCGEKTASDKPVDALAPPLSRPAVKPGDFQFPPCDSAILENYDAAERGNNFGYLKVTVDSKTLTCQFVVAGDSAATGDLCQLNLDTHKYIDQAATTSGC